MVENCSIITDLEISPSALKKKKKKTKEQTEAVILTT